MHAINDVHVQIQTRGQIDASKDLQETMNKLQLPHTGANYCAAQRCMRQRAAHNSAS